MRFLRTVSTRRLLALLSGLLIAAVGGTAIAIAATGNGPVPKAKRLSAAVRQALSAKAVAGVSASITFTNNLISSNDLQGTDPLLTGGPGRLWVAPGRLRLEVQSNNGDAEVVLNRGFFSVYDPATNVAYEGHLPAGAMTRRSARAAKHSDSLPTIAEIQNELNKLAAHLNISGAAPTDVAGQPAYRVTVSSKQNGGLLSDVQLAWDAVHGVPLEFAVYARGNSSPVLELQASGISYGKVPASNFAVSPPSGARIVKVALPTHSATRTKTSKRNHGRLKEIAGLAAVQRHVAFQVAAPTSAGGRGRTSVSLVGGAHGHGALVLYGHGLGAVAVIERPAKVGASVLPAGSADNGNGTLALPTTRIDGVAAQQLETPLGTLVQFTRGNVSYLVIGSVTAATADGVARGL